MATINVKFLTPVDRQEVPVTLSDDSTAEAVIGDLIAEKVIVDASMGYTLGIKGGADISGRQTLASGGAVEGSVININQAAKGGK
jgi:hypothetical protein